MEKALIHSELIETEKWDDLGVLTQANVIISIKKKKKESTDQGFQFNSCKLSRKRKNSRSKLAQIKA